MRIQFHRFTKRCFCCDSRPTGHFEIDYKKRLCTNTACSSQTEWREKERKLLASILPEWDSPGAQAFPGILPTEPGYGEDGSIVWADSQTELPESHNRYSGSAFERDAWRTLFPFESDFLASHGLRCGHAYCYRGKRLQDYTDSKEVFVLDMSSYNWSGTLKDPRMWSCINLAIANGVQCLWAWTAGNAGLALARIANAANAFLDPEKRLHVYLFYDGTDTAMKQDVLPKLRLAGGALIPVANTTSGVYGPLELQKKIKLHMPAPMWSKFVKAGSFWDVTDGWDGTGSVDYRRLFLQAFLRLQPKYVVMPLGTGNLLLGALLAGHDYSRLSGNEAPRCVCGVPDDQNIIGQIAASSGFTKNPEALRRSVRREPDTDGEVSRWTPKVAGYYSSLLACVEHAIHEDKVDIFGITERRLRQAYSMVCAPRHVTQPRYIRSEPSSAIAFAAYHNLVGHDTSVAAERVLVINSGCGIMGSDELLFIRNSITL